MEWIKNDVQICFLRMIRVEGTTDNWRMEKVKFVGR